MSTPALGPTDSPMEEGGERGHPDLDIRTSVDTSNDPESVRAKYYHKRGYVIQELIDTEKVYVKDLALVVEDYMKAIRENKVTLPPALERKDAIVFGNIHQIYDFHKDTFQPEIEKCLEDPQKLGATFVRFERRLYMYVKYCENKPKSEFIVAENIEFFEDMRQKAGHRLALPDMLIKPVQRIMKYQLLLKDILKHTERAGDDTKDIQRAVEVMCIIPKAANDMMNVGRLEGFEGKITAQGKLLLQGTLMIAEHSSKVKFDKQQLKERRVFLFEQIIIFSEEADKKKNNLMSNPGYIFRNSIKVNKMSMVDGDDSLRFVLVDKSLTGDVQYSCQAPNIEVKQNWVAQIRSILDMQGDFLRALQSPISYQKELTKELSAPDLGNLQLSPSTSSGLPPAPIQKSATETRVKSAKLPKSLLIGGNSGGKKSGGSRQSPDGGEEGKAPLTAGVMSPKHKRRLFEGFKHTLKGSKSNDGGRSKTDSFDDGNGCEEDEVDKPVGPVWVKATCDYSATKSDEMTVTKGDKLLLLNTSSSSCSSPTGGAVSPNGSGGQSPQMVLVGRPLEDLTTSSEGLVPWSILVQKDSNNGYKKPWHLRLRRSSLKADKDKRERESRSNSLCATSPVKIDGKEMLPPVFITGLTDVTVQVGSAAVFTCQLCGRPLPAVVWSGPPNQTILPVNVTDNIQSSHMDDVVILKLTNVTMDQAGTYTCTASNEAGSLKTSARLTVVSGSTSSDDRIHSPNHSQHRVPPIETDIDTQLMWQTGFDADFAKISEIARGRFSIVQRCIDMKNNEAVAAKCIPKTLLTRDNVVSEVSVMRPIHHESIVKHLQLFETSTAYIITFPIVPHGRLFEYLCTKSQFEESFGAGIMRQLLEVLKYIHQSHIAHLDIKPENLLIDLTSGTSPKLKVIDFGDARAVHPDTGLCHHGDEFVLRGSPEFAAPELINDAAKIGLPADIWSVGVVVYTMLSGDSPFLDKSVSDTCSSITRRDFCFTHERFQAVSSEAKDFISTLLVIDPSLRPTASRCLELEWILKFSSQRSKSNSLPTSRLIDFVERRRRSNDATVIRHGK